MKIECCDFCLKQKIIKPSKYKIGYGRTKIHCCTEHKKEAKEFIDNRKDYYDFYNILVPIANNLRR